MATVNDFETPNYQFPLLDGDVLPSWLQDWNDAFTKVDTALHGLQEQLDSGNGGGETITVDSTLTADSQNPVTSQAIYASQNQQDTLIQSIQASLTSINASLTAINGNITTLQGDVETINGQITTINGNITTINGNITTLQSDVESLTGRVVALEARP